jgi:acyl-CoA-dependent ceramide synthase
MRLTICLWQYLYVTSPYFLNLRELWTAWPDRELSGIMKGYMLAQWAFYLQQIIVINIEERRKDHWQMMSHHFVTTALIYACYSYHHTRVGTLILVIMDVGDLQLSVSVPSAAAASDFFRRDGCSLFLFLFRC